MWMLLLKECLHHSRQQTHGKTEHMLMHMPMHINILTLFTMPFASFPEKTTSL